MSLHDYNASQEMARYSFDAALALNRATQEATP